jgi:hypothetical protein
MPRVLSTVLAPWIAAGEDSGGDVSQWRGAQVS